MNQMFTWETARGIVLRPCPVTGWLQVLRGRRLKGRHTMGLYTFPGGRVEVGETSLQAAMREVWEETGLETAPLFARQRSIQAMPPNGINMVVHYHLLVPIGGTLGDSDELDNVAFVAPEGLLKKHAAGKRPFMTTDLAAWHQIVDRGLLPGMPNFHPREGAWPKGWLETAAEWVPPTLDPTQWAEPAPANA